MTSTGESEPGTQKEGLAAYKKLNGLPYFTVCGLAGTQDMQKLESPLVPLLCVPHYSDSSSVFTEKHSSYHMLGHCLRANIFPGAPVGWSSLVKDSYVNHPLQSLSPASQCWYGRRTDDMMRWTERNIINQRLQKALRETEKKIRPK